MKKMTILAAVAAAFVTFQPTLTLADEPKTLPEKQQLAQISLNLASAEQMAERLYGIGLAKAQAIVAYREAHGRFTNLEQLVEVKGIGTAILERNRELLTL